MPATTGPVYFGTAGTGGTSSQTVGSGKVISLDANQTIYSFNIASYASPSAFVIGSAADIAAGYTLTLTNVFRDANNSNTQTFAANINLAADSTWNIVNGFNGSVAVTGNIGSASDVVFTKDGTNSLSLSGINTFTGSLRILSGSLTLGNTNAYTGTTTASGGTLGVNFKTSTSTNTVNSGSALVLGGIRGGGAVTTTGNSTANSINSQTFNGLTLNSGASSMSIVNGTASGKTLVALGAITRNTGGTINFAQPTNNAVLSNQNGYTTTTANDATGIIGAYATVGGTDWAMWNGTNIAAYTGYTVLSGATPNIVDGATANVRINSTSTGDVGQAGGTVTVNTLNVNDATARVVTVGAGNTLRVGPVGGILSTGAGGLTIGASGNAGTLTAGGADNTAGELILNNSTALTVNSVVADNGTGAVALTKSGAGLTTLAAANTYTGGTTVNAGVLAFAGNNVISGTTGNSSTTLTVNTTGLSVGQTVSGLNIPAGTKIASITNGTTLVLSQATPNSGAATGNLTFYTGATTNALSTTGNITINGGTLELGSTSAAQTTSGAVVIAGGLLNNGTLTKSGANYDVRGGTISTKLAGSVGLDKTTAGALIFANTVANTYTGTTTITEGSVLGSATNVVSVSGNLVVGTADGSGFGASYSNNGSNINLNSASNVTVYSNGSVSLGGGAQYLSGTINLIGGSLSGSYMYLSNATFNLTGGSLSGGFYQQGATYNILASSTTSTVGIGTGSGHQIFNVADGAAATDVKYTGVLSGANNLTKNGAGLMLLTGAAKTYTGTTTVNQGTLALDFSGSGAPATNLISSSSAVSLAGATLNIIGKASTTNSQTFASTKITGGASSIAIVNDATANDTLVNLNALTRTGGTINLVQPVNGAVSATNGFTTSTANVNGIIGAWATVNETDWASNNGTNIVAASYTDLAGGTPSIINDNTTNVRITSGSTGAVGQASGTVTVNTLNANDATARTITVGTGNTLRLGLTGGILSSGAGGLTVGVSGNAGTLTAGGTDNTVSALILNNTGGSALAVNSVIANNGTGAVTLIKTGAGTTTLTGTNTFTGGVNVYQGTLSIAANAALGLELTGAALNLDGGTLQTTANVGLYNGIIGTNNRNVTLGTAGGTFDTVASTTLTVAGVVSGSGTLTKTGAGALALTNTNTNTGVTTISNGTLQLGTGGSTGRLAAAATIINNGNLAINRSNAVAQGTDFSTAAISGTGSFTQAGGGTTTLNAANTYSGATNINAGTLAVSSLANGGVSSNIGAATNVAANLVLNGGKFQYTGAAAATDRLFSVGTVGGSALDASGSGAINFSNTGAMGFNSQTGTRTFTLTGTNTGANTLAASIADNGGATSVSKTGLGQWVVTGASTYTGGLTVSAGTMATGATGSFGGGNINFTGGTLTFGNAASIADSATLSFDSANVTAVNLSFVGTEILFGLTNTSNSMSIGDGIYSANDLNMFFGSTVFAGGGYLSVGAVPEPATYAAIFGVLALAGAVLRRRRAVRG